jgi:hypothetical protein
MIHATQRKRLYQLCLTGILLTGVSPVVLAEDLPKDSTAADQAVPAWTSVFADYEAFETQPVLSWQALNKRVAEIGGWRTYAMEPYQDEGTEAEPPEHQRDLPEHGEHSGAHQ